MGRYIVGSSAVLGTTAGLGSLNSNATRLAPSVTATMNATGGTISYVGNYKIHTFTSSGTFTVTSGLNYSIEYLVIASGGGGGKGGATGQNGGGGGGGGFLEQYEGIVQGQDFCGPQVFVSTNDVLTVTVGAQAAQQSTGPSSTITSSKYYVESIGGGYGCSSGGAGGPGGSSGGSGSTVSAYAVVRPRQGYHNPTTNRLASSGAGGAAVTGSTAGVGRSSDISGSTVTYSAGARGSQPTTNGDANTGNGGTGSQGTSGSAQNGGTGGSGIVIIRYKYQ